MVGNFVEVLPLTVEKSRGQVVVRFVQRKADFFES
jgi:hypothetical protein